MAQGKRVRRIGREDCVGADPSPGVIREQAISVEGMWTGIAFTEPGVATGWHHHGSHETAVYVVSGLIRVESGPDGQEVLEAGVGEFVHVPAGVIHRESNPGEMTSSLVVMRAGSGLPTINVDGPE
jgi:uncharacterized RmlC-like cupin family protein